MTSIKTRKQWFNFDNNFVVLSGQLVIFLFEVLLMWQIDSCISGHKIMLWCFSCHMSQKLFELWNNQFINYCKANQHLMITLKSRQHSCKSLKLHLKFLARVKFQAARRTISHNETWTLNKRQPSLWLWIPYLPVYKLTPYFQGPKSDFSEFLAKKLKFRSTKFPPKVSYLWRCVAGTVVQKISKKRCNCVLWGLLAFVY